jgi:hypothetical protein
MSDDDHEPDAAVEAFEQVRGELALMRRAVERLAAERAEMPAIPDYSETLGRMAKALNATMQNVGVLAKAAEDNVAPRYVADRIVAAGAHARDEDRRLIVTAGDAMNRASRELQGVTGSALEDAQQRRRVVWTGIGGIVVGMILWAVLAGTVARSMPAGWQWPEKMATRTLRLEPWEAARRLASVSRPETWNAMLEGAIIVQDNRIAVSRCAKSAARKRAAVPCSLNIGPEIAKVEAGE